MDPRTPKHHRLTDSWRAGCRETGTSGSAERHGETTRRKPGTAPRADSNDVADWDFTLDDTTGELTVTTPTGRTHTTQRDTILKPTVENSDKSTKYDQPRDDTAEPPS
ncbi:hypothetical protein [Amycolatopsis taiwanensis]|uniref:hypothetical protein n=1 Tax=Amycolatopsis taiwanensis TaxID=342230 RepID=UPI0004817224|nr:hypothetical protein [Amycolatopsis taiwanensis]